MKHVCWNMSDANRCLSSFQHRLSFSKIKVTMLVKITFSSVSLKSNLKRDWVNTSPGRFGDVVVGSTDVAKLGVLSSEEKDDTT